MAATVPTQEPSEFRAGDSVLWTRSLADYPAPTWVLSYFLVGPSQKSTIVATADGTDHAVEITPAVTSPLSPGDYYLTGRVTDGTQVFTVVELRRVKVLPNFASDESVTPGYDGRTYWQQCLDTLKGMYSGAVAFPEAGYTIMGERQVQLKTFDEVQKAIQWVEGKIRQDEIAANPSAKNIYIRRREPR